MASHLTPHSEAVPLVAHTQTPEPLSAQEDALLRRILSAATFPGSAELLDQVRMVQLVPAISDAEHRIYVQHAETPRAPYSLDGRARIPGTVMIRHPEGRVIAQVDIWVERGHLRAMHLRWAGERAQITMPSPDWVVIEPEPAPPSPALSAAPIAPAAPRRLGRLIFALLLVACCGAVIAVAFLAGRRAEVDVDAARAAGAQQGQLAGTADGQVFGAFQGSTEGAIAGRASTHDASLAAAQRAALAKVRAAAATRAEAARVTAAARAAAVAPRSPDNRSCSGSRDSRGYWICS
ncbi:MAG: hypothetical protein H7287_03890 [Thermoleophilia bacterium]|nr:hypothetical protein [Thermoleophilia bacterium]